MRYPTLSELDRRTDNPWERPKRMSNYTPIPFTLGGGECWCGEEYQHDWPGKADGEPHPGRQNAQHKGN